MAATNKGRPVRQPDAEHPDLRRHPEGTIADARNDMVKLRNRPPVRFMSLFAESSPDGQDSRPSVDFHLDLSRATQAQLAEAAAYANEAVPVVDTVESHQAKLDARLGKLRELMQAAQSAGKAAQSPMSNLNQPQLPPFQQPPGFQSFTPTPDQWSEANTASAPFGSPYHQSASAVPPSPFPPPFTMGPTAPQPPLPFFAQKQAEARRVTGIVPAHPAPLVAADFQTVPPRPPDLRPTESATFHFPQGAFPGNYHHINVQRAADGRPVAIYLVYDNRFGIAPPFMATEVDGEFGLTVRGSRESYTVEATGLLHEFLDYTIGVLMVNQTHAAPDRG